MAPARVSVGAIRPFLIRACLEDLAELAQLAVNDRKRGDGAGLHVVESLLVKYALTVDLTI